MNPKLVLPHQLLQYKGIAPRITVRGNGDGKMMMSGTNDRSCLVDYSSLRHNFIMLIFRDRHDALG